MTLQGHQELDQVKLVLLQWLKIISLKNEK